MRWPPFADSLRPNALLFTFLCLFVYAGRIARKLFLPTHFVSLCCDYLCVSRRDRSERTKPFSSKTVRFSLAKHVFFSCQNQSGKKIGIERGWFKREGPSSNGIFV